MENPSQECKTYLISDTPSDDDKFTGAHSHVADSLVELLVAENDGGKAIGLEGNWGAGKSTVIRILKKKIEAITKDKTPSRFSVFVFDAWAHEGDPLRRTFLEKCISHVLSLGWLSKSDEWKNQLLALQGKLKNTKTTTTPQLGWLGFFIALFVLVGPLAIAFINKGISAGDSLESIQEILSNTYFLFGLLVYVGLFLLMTVVAMVKGVDAVSVVIQKFENESKTITIENPDPTSVEFEQIFLKLTDAIAEKNKHNKLIVVIDNLDRIEPVDALSIMSTLQTYIQSPAGEESVPKNIWVLIPYDPAGLRKLWQKEGRTIATSMIEKRFQVRFRVPPLVLTNWKDFLFVQLSKAFPTHSSLFPDDFEKVYSVYWTFWHSKANASYFPTPREIILFVNQIGAIHRQWCEKIPMSHMAYFVLLLSEDPLKQFEVQLEQGTIFESHMAKVLDKEEVVKNLASIWFNVDPGLAQELILARPVQNSLTSGDLESFNQLVATHRGLINVLEIFDFDNLHSSGEFESLARSFTTIAQSNLFANNNQNQTNGQLVNRLINSANSVSEWKGFNEVMGKGLGDLVSLSRNITIAKNALARISKNPEEGFSYSKETIGTWCLGVLSLYRSSKSIDKAFAINTLAAPTDTDGYITALGVFYSREFGKEICSILASPQPTSTVVGRIIELLKDDTQTLVTQTVIQALVSINETNGEVFQLQPLSDQVRNQLVAETVVKPKIIEDLYEWLEILVSASVAPSESIKTIVESGYVYHHLFNSMNSSAEDLSSKLIYYIISTNPLTPQPPDVPNSGSGFTMLKELLKDPENKHQGVSNKVIEIVVGKGEIDIFFRMLEGNEDGRQWAAWCLEKVLNSDYASSINPDRVQEFWKALRKHLTGSRFSGFINHVKIQRALLNSALRNSFSTKHAGFYSTLIKSQADEKLISWLQENMEKLSVDEWLENFNAETELLDLVAAAVNSGVQFDLDLKYSDALIRYLKESLEASKFPADVEKWTHLPKALRGAHKRHELKTNILSTFMEYVTKHSGDLPSQAFTLYGPELLDEKLLLETEKLFSNFITPMLSMPNEAGLAWFSNLLGAFPKLFVKYQKKSDTENETKVFLDRIKIQFQDQTIQGKVRSLIEEIGGKLDVDFVSNDNVETGA